MTDYKYATESTQDLSDVAHSNGKPFIGSLLWVREEVCVREVFKITEALKF